MSGGPRVWRKTQQKVSGKPYWSIQAGSRNDDDRVALALGFVTEEEADRALRNMQAEEEATYGSPRYDRVLRLYRGEIVTVGEADPDPEYVPDGSPRPVLPKRSPKQRAQDAARRLLLGDVNADTVFGSKPVEPDYKGMTVRAYYEAVYAPHRAALKPRSWRVEEQGWRRILDGMGDVRLRDVDEYVVDAYLSELRKKDGSPATWNMRRQHRNAITALLTLARRRRHYPREIPRWFRLEGSTERSHEEQPGLTKAQLVKLLGACGPQLRAIVCAGAGLGLRPNEITALRAEDIDWEAGTVKVRGTKTEGSAAVVPLLPIARAELAAWWEALGRPATGPLFRPQKRGSKGLEEYVVVPGGGHVAWRKALATAAAKALPGVRVTPYTLRHSAATLLVEAGTPIHSVAKLLRHSNPRMVEKHYDHTGAVRAPGLDRAPTLE